MPLQWGRGGEKEGGERKGGEREREEGGGRERVAEILCKLCMGVALLGTLNTHIYMKGERKANADSHWRQGTYMYTYSVTLNIHTLYVHVRVHIHVYTVSVLESHRQTQGTGRLCHRTRGMHSTTSSVCDSGS